jgi:hypothetical protein
MQRTLFLRIVEDIEKANQYFLQKRDAAGQLGFYTLQKATTAIQMLAYGCSADSLDEYVD